MEKEDLIREYNTKRSIRESLVVAREELARLEHEELIEKYLRLLNYVNTNKSLEEQSDEQIMDNILDKEMIEGDSTYFCYGKEYYGRLQMIGTYYLCNNPKGSIKVALYRSINNPSNIIILPLNKTEEFEKENTIIYSSSLNKDEEYHSIRRKMILGEKEHVLKKR